MKLDPPIETPRLKLRAYRRDDRDFSVGMWCDGENGAYMSDPLFADVDAEYLAYFDEMEDDPDGYYLIAERKDTGERIGTCCLFPEDDNCDIGYCVRKDRWHEGFGSEMLAGMLAWIRASGFRTVTAEVADRNAASNGLLAKSGFVSETATRFRKYGGDTVFDAHIRKLTLDPK